MRYQVDFLKSAPVLITVVGDPKKTGLDAFLEEGTVGYQYACSAAIQNMLLAAHALGLGSLWFTLYDKKNLRGILEIPEDKNPVGIVCLGKPGAEIPSIGRKELAGKVRFVAIISLFSGIALMLQCACYVNGDQGAKAFHRALC